MEDFVTYEQAKSLKELGFYWPCLYWYHPNEDDKTKRFRMSNEMNHNIYKRGISAPSLSLAQKWLREKEIEVGVFAEFDGEIRTGKWMWLVRKFNTHLYDTIFSEDISYDTYEEALTDAITKALEILNKDKDEK